MKVLVINSGSSSLKFQVYEMDNHQQLCVGLIDRVGEASSHIKYKFTRGTELQSFESEQEIHDHEKAITFTIDLLFDSEKGVFDQGEDLQVIGHRVVHGGEFFSGPTIINDHNLAQIKSIAHLAPLHNPANIMGIELFQQLYPKATQVAVFDTSFHQTIPEQAYRYAIPNDLYLQQGIRVYGMHGTSHNFITKALAKHLNKPVSAISLLSIHLGNGCSMAAVKDGQCIDTSMGFSPLNGLIMGTRSGDIDPAVLLFLMDELGYDAKKLNTLLNKKSGLLGLTGTNDVRDILAAAKREDEQAILALAMYAYRIKKYIGAYIAVLGKQPDAIVFTGGVGENAAAIREMCLSNLQHLGLELDAYLNDTKTNNSGIRELQAGASKVKIMVIPTNEELEIADQSYYIFRKTNER